MKEKRRHLRSLKDRMLATFKIPLAETDDLDLWQRAGLGFAVVSNDHALAEGMMEKMLHFIEQSGAGHIWILMRRCFMSRTASRLPYDRAQRVAEQMHQVISLALLSELADPRLRDILITRVSMTRDLRIARIFYHLLAGSATTADQALHGLKSASVLFKRIIAREMKLKFIPEIEIFYDTGIDHEDRIEELLRSIKGEQT